MELFFGRVDLPMLVEVNALLVTRVLHLAFAASEFTLSVSGTPIQTYAPEIPGIENLPTGYTTLPQGVFH